MASVVAVVAAVVIVLVVRWVTFDPKAFVSGVEETLDPFRPRAAERSRPAGAASSARSRGVSPAEQAERVRQRETALAALRQRYHESSGLCYRYPTKEDLPGEADERADEIADALLAADLMGRLDALVPASLQWARDADDAAHGVGPEVEVVEYFADEAGLWTKLGVALRRGATLEAARAALSPPPPPTPNAPLSPEEEARARPIWERYGHLGLVSGATRLAQRVHAVDLRGTQLRLLEPGMTESAVRARLGPAEEDGRRWRYPPLGTEVSFDEQGRVIGITSRLAYGDRVTVDGADAPTDEASLVRLLGKPIRDAQTEAGEAVLVYRAGPHAMLLVLAGQLARVELWRKDLVFSGTR